MQQSYSLESMLFAIFITLIVSFVVGFFFKRKLKDKGNPVVESQEGPEDKLSVKVGKKILEEKYLRWNTQDWIWLILFMVYAQLFTVLYKELVMDVVSYVSTFVSTALGAVAIYISVREATKIDKTKDDMNTILGELREKLSQMDTKMNKLDPKLAKHLDDTAEMATEEIASILQNNKDIPNDQLINIIREEINKANNGLIESLNENNLSYIERDKLNYMHQSRIKSFISNKENGSVFDLQELMKALAAENKVVPSSGKVSNILQSFVRSGFLKYDGILYTKI
ncbi:hypothetical protein [Paenibacillus albus]|uniref:Uncharacterized protein n=1 Tax=Paenibacillus albus TaxID=2495582 RepID=A0A3Q8X9B5_9BACL|nr:hypothetical protein [Paenibacillus albus]AZN43368.1 hypothetical protein EJC50_29505 [Paenibacillus albus]